jgi:hypothetical protein
MLWCLCLLPFAAPICCAKYRSEDLLLCPKKAIVIQKPLKRPHIDSNNFYEILKIFTQIQDLKSQWVLSQH